MKMILLVAMLLANTSFIIDPAHYLDELKAEMSKEWPKNRTINIVFHGHSVPAGYFKTPVVNTLGSYPHLLLRKLKEKYPFAAINVIVTAIGGENSDKGSQRFKDDVLTLKPDLIFIDYALNDRGIGLENAAKAWSSMIESANEKHIKLILLTPTPDQRENILDTTQALHAHTKQILALANKYQTGIVDNYGIFYREALKGASIPDLMSQSNHPNEKGHELVADAIFNSYFR